MDPGFYQEPSFPMREIAMFPFKGNVLQKDTHIRQVQNVIITFAKMLQK